jgi:predicted MFS family arabinose efflux permease
VPGESENLALADHQRKLLFVLGLATFMAGLDGRVVAPLLPSVGSEFGVSISTAGYLVSGYLLPYGLFQLAFALFLGGRVGSVSMGCLLDRYGYQRGFALAGRLVRAVRRVCLARCPPPLGH